MKLDRSDIRIANKFNIFNNVPDLESFCVEDEIVDTSSIRPFNKLATVSPSSLDWDPIDNERLSAKCTPASTFLLPSLLVPAAKRSQFLLSAIASLTCYFVSKWPSSIIFWTVVRLGSFSTFILQIFSLTDFITSETLLDVICSSITHFISNMLLINQ